MPAAPLLVVLTGPSGVGKDSVLARLKELGRPYHFAITATTRSPRNKERDGVDYYFVSQTEFERMRDNGELLENAIVYGHHYGVPKRPIREALARREDVIMRTDVQGARTIKSLIPPAITIFVAAPDDAELERRLRGRADDSEEQMGLRLKTAKQEQEGASDFDHVVVNRRLDECVAEVEAILTRERERPKRQPVEL